MNKNTLFLAAIALFGAFHSHSASALLFTMRPLIAENNDLTCLSQNNIHFGIKATESLPDQNGNHVGMYRANVDVLKEGRQFLIENAFFMRVDGFFTTFLKSNGRNDDPAIAVQFEDLSARSGRFYFWEKTSEMPSRIELANGIPFVCSDLRFTYP